jgi:hypothetical protein
MDGEGHRPEGLKVYRSRFNRTIAVTPGYFHPRLPVRADPDLQDNVRLIKS